MSNEVFFVVVSIGVTALVLFMAFGGSDQGKPPPASSHSTPTTTPHGEAAPSQATDTATVVSPPPAPDGNWRVWGWILALAGAIGLGFALFMPIAVETDAPSILGSGGEQPRGSTAGTQGVAERTATTEPSVTKPASAWRYENTENAMGDGETATACVTSENVAQLQWPYESVSADLCLRNSPQFGRDAYVHLNGDGQMLCDPFDGCRLRIRFGDKKARPISAGPASDHSSNIVFIKDRSSLEQGLKTADKTAIEIEFYEAGRQALVFPTKGLDWSSE